MRTTPLSAQAGLVGDGSSLTPANYEFLQHWIHKESGIHVGGDKLYLFQSRLLPVAKSEAVGSLDALCQKLRTNPGEGLRRKVVEAMTTHETLFFRDPPAFDALRGTILPELATARQSTRTLRVWSAACSSGQEPYSVAISLLESGLNGWDFRILGTDLSKQILERAKAGRYHQNEINRGLPAPMLLKYFERAGLDWQVKKSVRRLVTFSPVDLRHVPPDIGSFDLVLCRNVMIYFDVDTKKKILNSLLRAVAQDGYLLLGAAETTLQIDSGLERKQIGSTVWYRARSRVGAA